MRLRRPQHPACLEAKMALYGHEIHASILPLGSRSGLDRQDEQRIMFLGREAIEAVHAKGLTRKLTGFEMTGRGIGRDGYEVWIDGTPAGFVTSGGPSPTLSVKTSGCGYPPRL